MLDRVAFMRAVEALSRSTNGDLVLTVDWKTWDQVISMAREIGLVTVPLESFHLLELQLYSVRIRMDPTTLPQSALSPQKQAMV